MSRTRTSLVLTVTATLASACATRPILDASAPGASPTLALSTYYEEGTQAMLVVGSRPALSRRDRPYIPLEIAVVNKGLRSLTLTPESFTLIDPEQRRYPMATPAELSRAYGSTDLDRRLGEVEPILRRKYLQYDRIPSNFTPGYDRPVGLSQVALYRFSYFVDMIYFPNPTIPTADGPFELLVRAPELEDPLVIRFYVGPPRRAAPAADHSHGDSHESE